MYLNMLYFIFTTFLNTKESILKNREKISHAADFMM